MVRTYSAGVFADFLIVVVCIIGILCACQIPAVIADADESIRRAEQTSAAVEHDLRRTDEMVFVTVFPEEEPDEDALIEAALLEQGYFREDIPLSYDLQDALHTACEEFDVEYSLALAVIEAESNFTNVTGDSGESVGYFQIQPRWWNGLMAEIGVDDLTDPAQNFRTGCAILELLVEQYDGDTDAALTAYNVGRDTGDRTYANKVLGAAGRWSE